MQLSLGQMRRVENIYPEVHLLCGPASHLLSALGPPIAVADAHRVNVRSSVFGQVSAFFV